MKISIVTPSFNQGVFLDRTIDSVLKQRGADYEYMVMDGGSCDSSVDVIRKYEHRLTYWRSHPDGGQAAAIHEGFSRSSGEVLGWLNSDDILLPNALATVTECFERSDLQVLVGHSYRIDENDRIIKAVLAPRLSSKQILFWGTGFDQPASFWRRDLYHKVGGLDTSLSFCFDYSFYLAASRHAKFSKCPAFLAALRVHPRSKTSRMQEVRKREMEIVRSRNGYYKKNIVSLISFRLFHSVLFRARQQLYNLLIAPSKGQGVSINHEHG